MTAFKNHMNLEKPKLGAAILVFSVAMQAILLLVVAQNSLHAANPDAMSYLRVAQHYYAGNFNLAVNGYWGPLFSWLCIPFLTFSGNPILPGRIVMAISAIIFFLGSLSTLMAAKLKWMPTLFSATLLLLFTVNWSVTIISPDLLMGGFLLAGIGGTLSASAATARNYLLLSGLAYGLSYLTKSIALPESLGSIFGLTLIKLLAGTIDRATAKRIVGWTCSGFVLLALPWIITLSLHYGKPTFSTSGPIAHALVGPNVKDHPYTYTHFPPAEGRLFSWEEPSTDPGYQYWSPFTSRETFVYQLNLIHDNIKIALGTLAKFIAFSLSKYDFIKIIILVTCLTAFFWPGSWRNKLKVEPWRLSVPAIPLLSVAYLPVFAEDLRYFLACFPMLLIMAFGFAENVAAHFQHKKFIAIGLPIFIFTLFSATIIRDLYLNITRGNRNNAFVMAENLAPGLRNQDFRSIASIIDNDQKVGLYVSFLTGIPYYGNRSETASVQEAFNSGAELLFINQNHKLNQAILHDPAFQQMGGALQQYVGIKGIEPINIYRVLHKPLEPTDP